MEKTNALLDNVKARYGLPSDYKLAARLGLSRALVSKFRNEPRVLSDETGILVADLLQLPAAYVLASLEAERAKNPVVRQVWENLAHSLKPKAGRRRRL